MVHPITPEDLFAIHLTGSIVVGPAGRIFFVDMHPDREKDENVSRIMTVAPGEGIRPFTQGPNDMDPALSPDGKTLAFLAKRTGAVQVWAMDAGGGEARQITRASHGVRSFAWSPDSTRIAFLTQEGSGIEAEEAGDKEKSPEEKGTSDVRVYASRMYRLDGEGFFPMAPPQIGVTDLDGHARIITKERARIWDLSWSGDGTRIRFTAHRSDDIDIEIGEIWEVPAEGGDVREVFRSREISADGLVFTPERDATLFVASEVEALGYDNPVLTLLRPGEGPRFLGRNLDRPVGSSAVGDLVPPEGVAVYVQPDLKSALALVSVDGTGQIARIPLDGADAEVLTSGDHVITSFAPHPKGFAVSLQSAEVPSDVFLLGDGAPRRLTDVNRDLMAEIELGAIRRFKARAEGGPEIDAWLVMPPASVRREGPLPAVLQIHGGPMAQYTRAVMIEHQLIAAQGIAVIASNPRGTKGYGRDFCEAIKTEWGAKDYDDLIAVTDEALRQEPSLDPERIGVAGGSYGGYMTCWMIGHTDRFRAAHAMRPVVDWRAESGTSDIYWNWVKRFKSFPWEDDERIRQQSPITYVEAVRTPVLLESQEGDFRCPIEQGEMYYAAMKLLGRAPIVFVRYPDEFHGMSRTGKPWHRVHRLRLLRDWWRHFLLGEEAQGVLAAHLQERRPQQSASKT